MKKIAVAAAMMMVLSLGFSVKPASAGGGHFWGGFAAGTATGLVVGTLAAPPVYYAPAPAPVYVYPAPVCRDYQTQGYWRQVQVVDAYGSVGYRNDWVPGTVQRVCQ